MNSARELKVDMILCCRALRGGPEGREELEAVGESWGKGSRERKLLGGEITEGPPFLCEAIFARLFVIDPAAPIPTVSLTEVCVLEGDKASTGLGNEELAVAGGLRETHMETTVGKSIRPHQFPLTQPRAISLPTTLISTLR